MGRLVALQSALAGLPGEVVPLSHPLISPASLLPTAFSTKPDRSVNELRRETAAWLSRLSEHIDAALQQAVADVERKWDVFDSVPLVPVPLRVAGIDLRDAWRTWLQTQPRHATEALWTIEATLALVRTFERRLASLVRARITMTAARRREDNQLDRLLVGGRPFVDLAAALQEVARAWT